MNRFFLKRRWVQPWHLYQMVTRDMLRTYKGKQVFWEKNLICDCSRSNEKNKECSSRAHLFLSSHLIQVLWMDPTSLNCHDPYQNNLKRVTVTMFIFICDFLRYSINITALLFLYAAVSVSLQDRKEYGIVRQRQVK